jgi:hypothetical protein
MNFISVFLTGGTVCTGSFPVCLGGTTFCTGFGNIICVSSGFGVCICCAVFGFVLDTKNQIIRFILKSLRHLKKIHFTCNMKKSFIRITFLVITNNTFIFAMISSFN